MSKKKQGNQAKAEEPKQDQAVPAPSNPEEGTVVPAEGEQQPADEPVADLQLELTNIEPQSEDAEKDGQPESASEVNEEPAQSEPSEQKSDDEQPQQPQDQQRTNQDPEQDEQKEPVAPAEVTDGNTPEPSQDEQQQPSSPPSDPTDGQVQPEDATLLASSQPSVAPAEPEKTAEVSDPEEVQASQDTDKDSDIDLEKPLFVSDNGVMPPVIRAGGQFVVGLSQKLPIGTKIKSGTKTFVVDYAADAHRSTLDGRRNAHQTLLRLESRSDRELKTADYFAEKAEFEIL